MKRILKSVAVFFFCLLAAVGFTAYRTIKAYEDIFAQLGIEKKSAESYILHGFMNGKLSSPKSIYGAYKWNTGKRKEALVEIARLVKDYTASDYFKDEYIKMRMKNMMREEDYREMKMHVDMMKDYISTMEKKKKEREAKKQEVDEYTLTSIQSYYNQKKQVEEYEAAKKGQPEPGFTTVQGGFIAGRLQQFLDMSATVDFDAQLRKEGTKMVFVNPEYERKSEDWKKCYRAGKELTGEAQRISREWIEELKVKKQ
jgi:hypothetical protein